MTFRALGRLLVLTLLLAATVRLALVGAADFLRLAPCVLIDEVQRTDHPADPAALATAHERLMLAGRVDPWHPIVPEYLAILAVYRARMVHDDVALYRTYLDSAREQYAAALALRPHSAYLRSGMMIVLAGLLDARAGPDEALVADFGLALAQAAGQAAWEPVVLAAVARVGTQHAALLDEAGRQRVSEARERLSRLAGGRAPSDL